MKGSTKLYLALGIWAYCIFTYFTFTAEGETKALLQALWTMLNVCLVLREVFLIDVEGIETYGPVYWIIKLFNWLHRAADKHLIILLLLAFTACQSQDDFLDEVCSCEIEIDETEREWITFYVEGCHTCCQVMSMPILECRTQTMQDSVGRQFLRELYGRKPHCDPGNEFAITNELLRSKGLKSKIGKRK